MLDGCAASWTIRWCAGTYFVSRSLSPPVLRFRSYFGKAAEATDTRRRCPLGITIDVNHTSMSYLVIAPGVSSDGLSNPFLKRARATPSWMRHAAPAGSTSRIITFQSVSRASVAAQSVAAMGPVISIA